MKENKSLEKQKDTDERGVRRCETCQKKNKVGTACLVLNEMIGKTRPCWAWTDDPDWRQKHKEAVKAYQAGKCFLG